MYATYARGDWPAGEVVVEGQERSRTNQATSTSPRSLYTLENLAGVVREVMIQLALLLCRLGESTPLQPVLGSFHQVAQLKRPNLRYILARTGQSESNVAGVDDRDFGSWSFAILATSGESAPPLPLSSPRCPSPSWDVFTLQSMILS